MKKKLILVLLTLIGLFGCQNINSEWTEKQNQNMINYAKQMFQEVKTIVNEYNGIIIGEKYGDKEKTKICHFVHNNGLAFIINNNLYNFSVCLTPNANDEVEIHQITLDISTPTFNNLEDSVFIKEDFLIITDLMNYFENYTYVDFLMNLDQITYYIDISKKSYEENKNKEDGYFKYQFLDIYYYEWVSLIQKNDKKTYYYFIYLTFSKCSKNL